MKREKIKFKIGEFSKLCRVTVKTLRLYEEIELLIPAEVDRWSGYRYYNLNQMEQMEQILYLKKLGFSLEQIREVLEEPTSTPPRELLLMKIRECENELAQLQWRQQELALLERKLHKQAKMMENVIVKSLPSRIFATHRRVINNYQELFNLCPNILGPEMARLGCECPAPEYCFTVEHDGEYTGTSIDIEYFEAVAERKEDSELIQFKELEEVPTALCINHYGPYEKMPTTFHQLFSYAEEQGYEVCGLARFSYIDGIWNKESEEEWLTEIQLPVRK